jgi:hypothetical protein
MANEYLHPYTILSFYAFLGILHTVLAFFIDEIHSGEDFDAMDNIKRSFLHLTNKLVLGTLIFMYNLITFYGTKVENVCFKNFYGVSHNLYVHLSSNNSIIRRYHVLLDDQRTRFQQTHNCIISTNSIYYSYVWLIIIHLFQENGVQATYGTSTYYYWCFCYV